MLALIKEIFTIIGKDGRRKLPFLVVLFVLTSMLDLVGLGLIGPYIALIVDPGMLDVQLGQVFKFFGLPQDHQLLINRIGFLILFIFVLKAISAIGIQWKSISFSQQQKLRLQFLLMRTYQSMPYTEYLNRNSSEFIYSIQDLTGQFSSAILVLLSCVSCCIIGFVIIALLVWTNAMALALLVVLLVTTVYGYDRIFRKNQGNYGIKLNDASTSMQQSIHEGIKGLKEIRVLGYENYFHRRVLDGARQLAKYGLRREIILMVPTFLLEIAVLSFVVLLVFIFVTFEGNIQEMIPTLGVFGVAALRLKPITSVIASSLSTMRLYRDSISRLYRDLEDLGQLQIEPLKDAEKTPSDLNHSEDRRDPFHSLELQNLGFIYPNAQCEALQDISLQIQVGESVGLIGPSGAGKTTLVDVLLGLLEGQEGSMRYNGKPLKENLSGWRAHVAYLPQEVFLTDNTLRRNVALCVEDELIDDDRLLEALRQARLTKLVDQLPQGVDTLLGERGVRLSGGQRQRVALARAFYHERSVLVMDEATSSLDQITEEEIVGEIRHLKGKITLIVIAHRLTTVQYCDRIYRLDNGRLIDSGTPEQILNMKKVTSA